jgi:hypothetical protein
VIKILRPEPLQVVEKGLRAVGYDPHVDEFVSCSPAAGTSRLANCLTTTFPEMSVAEAIETISVNCVAGRTGARTTLATTRPSRARIRQSRMWG